MSIFIGMLLILPVFALENESNESKSDDFTYASLMIFSMIFLQ